MKINQKIPLAIPNLQGNELNYLKQCIDENFISSIGPFVNKFEEKFAEFHQTHSAVAVVNGTAALHLALVLCQVGSRDEVLVPNLTFVAPLNAVSYTGATPVLIDSEWKTLGMCPTSLKHFLDSNLEMREGKAFNKNTDRQIKAIIPMHTLGTSVDLDPIMETANSYNLKVIEDASEALGAQYKGRPVGTIGDYGSFSFNGNKIITSGGGGMMLSRDTANSKAAKHLSTTAKTNGITFFHDQVGYNYRMVNLLAAVGLAQFEQLPDFLRTKKKNAEKFKNLLSEVDGAHLYWPKEEKSSNYWFYSLVLSEKLRIKKMDIIHSLISENIDCRPVWTLMEDLPMYGNCPKSACPISREIFDSIISIPCSTSLKEEQIEYIVKKIKDIIN